jgi:ADP-ribose pyrophosphatase YjhB (NUDIX family)
MAEKRIFCRFNKYWDKPNLAIKEIPEGGFCLSAFLILTKTSNANEVLLGKVNPIEKWEYVGALDLERAKTFSKGWMLPSSHLIFGEDPNDAAYRILKEQLNLEKIELKGPIVVSFLYPSARFPQFNHWDIEFIYQGSIDSIRKNELWSELEFVNINNITKKDFARGHEDILEAIGYKLKE